MRYFLFCIASVSLAASASAATRYVDLNNSQAVLHWTLTTLREKPIKIGAKVVRHSRIIAIDPNISHR